MKLNEITQDDLLLDWLEYNCSLTNGGRSVGVDRFMVNNGKYVGMQTTDVTIKSAGYHGDRKEVIIPAKFTEVNTFKVNNRTVTDFTNFPNKINYILALRDCTVDEQQLLAYLRSIHVKNLFMQKTKVTEKAFDELLGGDFTMVYTQELINIEADRLHGQYRLYTSPMGEDTIIFDNPFDLQEHIVNLSDELRQDLFN